MVANINHINNNELRIISPFNRYQQIAQNEAKIERIDKEISARQKYVSSLDDHIQLLKTNNVARQEYVQTLSESRDLDKKRIELLAQHQQTTKDMMDILQKIIERNGGKVDPIKDSSLKEFQSLASQVKTLDKKDNILKEKSTNLDTKIDKLELKVEYTEKQVAKLESKVEAKASVVPTINENSFKKKSTPEYASTYKPSDMQIPLVKKFNAPVIELEHRPSNKKLDEELRQQVYQSQKNLYDSIIASHLKKLI